MADAHVWCSFAALVLAYMCARFQQGTWQGMAAAEKECSAGALGGSGRALQAQLERRVLVALLGTQERRVMAGSKQPSSSVEQ